MKVTPNFRNSKLFKISLATEISETGLPVRETRMVSPIPLARIAPMPTEDLIVPEVIVPASVIPT